MTATLHTSLAIVTDIMDVSPSSGDSQADEIIPDAEASNRINGPVENIRAVNSGDEFFACLQAIPPGRNAKSQGYSYNRFIKVLNASGNLPVEFTELNYGSMKIGPKNMLHGIIKSLRLETHGKKLFDDLKDSLLFSYDVQPAAVTTDVPPEGITVNRWALLAEFYIHPASRDAHEDYFTKIPPAGKNQLLTDGMKQHRMSQVAALMKLCIEEVAPNVRNCFGARWPALINIHPEKGGFADAEQFGSLMTEMRNVFDVLKSNLSKSGTQESGEILDGTALEFCKYHQRTAKLNHFYLWLCWKDQDLNFLSNSLREGVATGGDSAPEQYTRSTVSSVSGSSVKLSTTERKAAKGIHFEKVAATIGDVIQKSIGSLTSEGSSSTELAAAKAKAYISKETELTLEVKLKRQRDALEAPSFQDLSPDLQRYLRRSYALTLRDSM